jgi:hypothetical protein
MQPSRPSTSPDTTKRTRAKGLRVFFGRKTRIPLARPIPGRRVFNLTIGARASTSGGRCRKICGLVQGFRGFSAVGRIMIRRYESKMAVTPPASTSPARSAYASSSRRLGSRVHLPSPPGQLALADRREQRRPDEVICVAPAPTVNRPRQAQSLRRQRRHWHRYLALERPLSSPKGAAHRHNPEVDWQGVDSTKFVFSDLRRQCDFWNYDLWNYGASAFNFPALRRVIQFAVHRADHDPPL